jgi:hypothetical protein
MSLRLGINRYDDFSPIVLLHCEFKVRQRGAGVIIPLVGLFISCAIFTCIGAAVLALLPHLRATLANVGLFVIGAVPTSAVAAVAYGRVFGRGTGELHGGALVLSLFGIMLVAGLCGGLLTVLAYRWLMRTIRLQRESGTPVHT